LTVGIDDDIVVSFNLLLTSQNQLGSYKKFKCPEFIV